MVNSLKIFRSKTVWGAIIAGVAHALVTSGVISPELGAWVEAAGTAVFGIGARQAIAKNGEGK
jgi:hypothetical protein